jgi:hypothetical protein
VDPNGLAYTPDAYAFSSSGILYLLHRGTSSVFRWSVQEQRYLSTIPLADAPSFIALSEVNNALYLAYSSGKITVIHLDQTPTEAPFANLPQAPVGLATAGEFVFAADRSGAWATHYTFSSTGALITSKDWNYVSTEYIWSQDNRKMYFFRDGSPSDLLWENIDLEGNLGPEGETPYHTSDGIEYPIRVAPGGNYVLLGSGRLFTPIMLEQFNALSNDINDAAWISQKLFTMRLNGAKTQIQAWTNTYGIAKATDVAGAPMRLFSAGTSLVAVTNVENTPVFTILSPALQVTFQSPLPPALLANVSTRRSVGTGDNVLISGFIITGSESKKVILRGIGPSLAGMVPQPLLQDPRLDLFDAAGAPIASNSNWQDSQPWEVYDTGIAPTDDREAAIVATLAPGFYTFALSAENGSSNGTGVIEAYDLSTTSNSTLANISTRGLVAAGDDVMIAGFILTGDSDRSANILLRGIGPSLTKFNVSGALPNPAIEVRDVNGSIVAANDDWQATQKTELETLGVAPSDPKEAALLQKLATGSYTVLLSGANHVGGVGLIEVYNVR